MTQARVEINHGEPILVDSDAVAVGRAVGKHNCGITLEGQADRVAHFKGRIAARGLTAAEVVIVLLNVDDRNGAGLAEVLMPGYDWQPYRERGEVPFARGLADREFVEAALALFDQEAAAKLRESEGNAVVVVDHGVAEIFQA